MRCGANRLLLFVGLGRDAHKFPEIAVKGAEIVVAAQTAHCGDLVSLPDVVGCLADAAEIQVVVKSVAGDFRKQFAKAAFGHGRAPGNLFQRQGFREVVFNISDAV